MSRSPWAWARTAGAGATLAIVVWRLGAGPFRDGVLTVDARTLAAAAGLGLVTSVCCAWRWKIVARGLGIDLPLPAAVAAYYRSQFLNLTLPGGIVGDIHRGVSHGRDVHDVGRGVRAVVWERCAGQVVQVILTVVVLLVLPSPVHSLMPLVAIAAAVALAGIVLAARRRPAGVPRGWPGIVLASVSVVGAQAVTFLIAARTAGAGAPPSRMLPLALLVMLAMVLPSIGGFGPREGSTAWAFGAAGLGADLGVATAVVYGVMVLVASLPGAAVLAVGWFRRARAPVPLEVPLPRRAAIAVRPDGGPHG
jgi:glycosyltransferase 2 family protein